MADEFVRVSKATGERIMRALKLVETMRIEGPGVEVRKTNDSLAVYAKSQPSRGRIADERPGVLFAVKVEKDGGSDGSKTTVASWTYTVQDLAGNQLGTGVALTHPRPKGKAAYQTGTFSGGTAGYGTGFYDGTTFKLWCAGETPTTGACP